MKLLITGDLHLRASNPENRIDNFFETQLGKMEEVFKIASENCCQTVLCPGDVFDNPRPSFDVLEYYIQLFKKYDIGKDKKIEFLTVWGQHDCRFRTHDRTALKLMEFLGYMKTFKKKTLVDGIDLYGCDYGDEIPKIENADNFNILLIHKTIVDKPQWFGQEDFLQSDKLFKSNPYDIIVSGDYHRPVFYEYKNQVIVNCGVLVRKTIAEADLQPHVYILEIDEDDLTYNLKKIELKYKPAEEVFRKEALERTSTQDNKKMIEFINSIKSNEISSSLDFKKNLGVMLKSAEEDVKNIVLKELEDLNE